MKINEAFLSQMREATTLLQTSGPMAATAAIQRALRGAETPSGEMPMHRTADSQPQPATLIDINPPPATDEPTQGIPSARDFLARFRTWADAEWSDISVAQPPRDGEADLAGKGQYVSGSLTNQAGTRAYKLYIPSGYAGDPLPLIVMLHGCKQDPDDFAAGTTMNAVAEENNCLVVYPAQVQKANGSNCWNWFESAHQRRDRGEPSIIADITREIISRYAVDADRVYVAGMSAGGAMAAIMGANYPELYAAVGIHSGLPYGAAHDLPSAFAAMKNTGAGTGPRRVRGQARVSLRHTVPVIVFHGDRDTTVHPLNGDQALAQFAPAAAGGAEAAGGPDGVTVKVEKGAVPGGRNYTKTISLDAAGTTLAEQWVVHGAGHAWSGGSSQGSYTDPKGPSAAREMVRFFFSHARGMKTAG